MLPVATCVGSNTSGHFFRNFSFSFLRHQTGDQSGTVVPERMLSTRAEPLSFRAIKDLAFAHCTVGRKSRRRLLAVGHYASWHPKKTIIRVQS